MLSGLLNAKPACAVAAVRARIIRSQRRLIGAPTLALLKTSRNVHTARDSANLKSTGALNTNP